MSLGNSLDLPFEEGDGGNLPDDHVHIAGGIIVMAAHLPVPGVGETPALVFRFAKPDGSGFYPPIVLIADPDQLLKLSDLVRAAARAAVKASTT